MVYGHDIRTTGWITEVHSRRYPTNYHFYFHRMRASLILNDLYMVSRRIASTGIFHTGEILGLADAGYSKFSSLQDFFHCCTSRISIFIHFL